MSRRGGSGPPPFSNFRGRAGRFRGAFERGGGRGGAFHGGRGNFQGAGQGAGSFSGAAANSRGNAIARGGRVNGGDAGNSYTTARGRGAFSGSAVHSQRSVIGRDGMPPAGPRHGGSNSLPAMSKVQEYGPACYKPLAGDYQDQIDATAKGMGMNEHDVNCLRCGLSKADGHLDRNICHRPCVRCPDAPHLETDCPRLYFSRSWHNSHGFDLRCPNDAISSGRMRIRPTPNDIAELIRLGCTWAHDIEPAENLSTGSKRSAGDTFGEEEDAAFKRAKIVERNALTRMHAEIKLKTTLEQKIKAQIEYMHTLQRMVLTQGTEIARLHAQAGTTPAANDAWPALDATDAKPAAIQEPFFKTEDASDADEEFAVVDTGQAAVIKVEDADDGFAATMGAEAARDQPAESQVTSTEDADVPNDEAWEGW